MTEIVRMAKATKLRVGHHLYPVNGYNAYARLVRKPEYWAAITRGLLIKWTFVNQDGVEKWIVYVPSFEQLTGMARMCGMTLRGPAHYLGGLWYGVPPGATGSVIFATDRVVRVVGASPVKGPLALPGP